MNVLSLFDGISVGHQALKELNTRINNYFSSEIDKYALEISKKNHDQIHLGDVKDWREWDLPEIDLLIGGSPCQGFSFAGKQLNFEDERSKLFFEFVDIKNHYKPKHFLFENVKMRKDIQDEISRLLGCEPIEINSALVSAQNRKRLYWTNIPCIGQPEDRDIYLKDIIENGAVDREKSFCLDANYWKGGNLKSYFEKHRRQLVFNERKANCLRARCNNESLTEKGMDRFVKKSIGNYVFYNKPHKVHQLPTNKCQSGRIYSIYGKSVCLQANGGGVGAKTGLYAVSDLSYRKLTVIECERLQTLPDNYTEGVSNTQRYKMLGNSWTLEVIKHILKGLL